MNERIAKIDGKCACKGPAYSTSVSSAGPPSCHVCHKPHRPDYDTGELIRVAMGVADSLDASLVIKYQGREQKFTAIIIGKGRGDSDKSLNAALVAAILESVK